MAKGKDSKEFLVLSQVRTGLKREFAFALREFMDFHGVGDETAQKWKKSKLKELELFY